MSDEELCKALRSALWGQGHHINIKAADRIEQLERERDAAQIDRRIFHLNAEALSEIKAVVDGHSEQSIKAIIYDLLAELEGKE